MTQKQREQVISLNAQLLSHLVMPIEYKWHTIGLSSDAYLNYIDAMKNIDIDWTHLTKEDALALGLRQFSEDGNLYAIPLHLIQVIPSTVKVYNLFTKEPKTNLSELDNDTRFGCLAYGLPVVEQEKDKISEQSEDTILEL